MEAGNLMRDPCRAFAGQTDPAPLSAAAMSNILSRETLVETFLQLGRALVEVPEGERAWLEGEVAGLIVHFTKDFLEIVATAKDGPELKLSRC